MTSIITMNVKSLLRNNFCWKTYSINPIIDKIWERASEWEGQEKMAPKRNSLWILFTLFFVTAYAFILLTAKRWVGAENSLCTTRWLDSALQSAAGLRSHCLHASYMLLLYSLRTNIVLERLCSTHWLAGADKNYWRIDSFYAFLLWIFLIFGLSFGILRSILSRIKKILDSFNSLGVLNSLVQFFPRKTYVLFYYIFKFTGHSKSHGPRGNSVQLLNIFSGLYNQFYIRKNSNINVFNFLCFLFFHLILGPSGHWKAS